MPPAAPMGKVMVESPQPTRELSGVGVNSGTLSALTKLTRRRLSAIPGMA